MDRTRRLKRIMRPLSTGSLLLLAAALPCGALAQLESSASVCLVAGSCVFYPEYGDADLGTTSAAASVGGATARAETGYGHYAARASIDVSGIGPPAATGRAYSIDTLTLTGGPGTSGTVWFSYVLSGTIHTAQPAVNPVFAHFEMSSAPTGETLLVNPASWTVRAGAQPATLVYQDESLYVPVTLTYGVPTDVGASLRVQASINGPGGVASVDFLNTVTLTAVTIPAGAALSAASGTDYLRLGAPVPLPSALVLVGAPLFLMARRKRGRGPAIRRGPLRSVAGRARA
ncbi:MAG: hypothetical protein RLW62_06065 [Gammaproteobacteria bacterium]